MLWISCYLKKVYKKYWTQQELEVFFQRETIDKKVILSLCHVITNEEVHAFSLILYDLNVYILIYQTYLKK
jgi:hypothetical protein